MFLLASCPRGLERQAYVELKGVLKELEFGPIKREPLNVSGLLLIQVVNDPLEVTRKVRSMTIKDPWTIKLLLKLKPIQSLVDSELSTIVQASNQLSSTIQEEESFRVTLNRRHTSLDPKVIVEEVAKSVERRVDLDHPDKIILVEILGPRTGVSVVTPDDIISFVRIKRGDGIE